MPDTVFYTLFSVRILHPLPNEKPRNHNGSEVFSLFPMAAEILPYFILRKDHTPRAPFRIPNAHQNANGFANDFRSGAFLEPSRHRMPSWQSDIVGHPSGRYGCRSCAWWWHRPSRRSPWRCAPAPVSGRPGRRSCGAGRERPRPEGHAPGISS